MDIQIQGSGLVLEELLQQGVQQRIAAALGQHEASIVSVQIALTDCGTSDRVGDKRCQVKVELHEIDDVLVESVDANLHIAIHRAVDRAGWTVARATLRQKRKTLSHLLKPASSSGRAASDRAV